MQKKLHDHKTYKQLILIYFKFEIQQQLLAQKSPQEMMSSALLLLAQAYPDPSGDESA